MTMPLISLKQESANARDPTHNYAMHQLRRLTIVAAASIVSTLFYAQSNAKPIVIAPIASHPSVSYSAKRSARVLRTSDDKYDQLGMEKLAEMSAFARHNEDCDAVPREWSIAFIVLVMTNPPPEAQVETEEKKILALRRKIGKRVWCALYRVDMQEAYLVYRFATGQ